MDLSNTRVPESFTIYRNFIHFRQPARPPPVRSEQLRPCRQKPKTQRVRRPARSGGGRAQGEPRCKPERGSRKCAWAMWRCRRRTQEAEAKALRRGLAAFLQKGLAKKLQSAASRTSIAHGKKSRGKPYHPAESRQVSATMGCFCTPCVAGMRSSFGRKAGNKSAPAATTGRAADARRASRGANRNATAGSVRGQCGAAAGGCRRRRQKRCGARLSAFLQKGLAKKLPTRRGGKGRCAAGRASGRLRPVIHAAKKRRCGANARHTGGRKDRHPAPERAGRRMPWDGAGSKGRGAAARRLPRGSARGVNRSAAAQGCRPFCKKAWQKTFQPAAGEKGSRHTGSSIGSAQCTRADCLFW